MTTNTVDFLLITALEEELSPLLDRLPGYEKLDPVDDDTHVYYKATISAILPSGTEAMYNIIACGIMSMGRVSAATVTTLAIHKWHPRFVILIGIAGGVLESGASLGDILISDQIVDYELQKQHGTYDSIRYSVHRTDPRLLGAAINFADDSWISSTTRRPTEGKPRRRVGPIATGDKVVARKELIDRYRQDWPKLIGVEMEAGGVAMAVYRAASKPGFFMVRGVSDLADENKDSSHVTNWREYACSVAAAYSIALLRSGPVPPANYLAPPDSNLDQAIKHALTVDLSTDEIKTKIETDIAINDQEGIFGLGGLCAGYPLNPRPERCFLGIENADGSDDLMAALSLALREFKVSPIKSSDVVVSGSLLCKVASLIRETRFGIYELTADQDRNIYLQLGMAIGLRRPFLLLKHRDVELSRLASGLDYYPVDSYLELKFGLKHKVRDFVVNMSHYPAVTGGTATALQGVFIEHGDIDHADFAYTVTKSLNNASLKPVFGRLDNKVSAMLEGEHLAFDLIEETTGSLLHQVIAAIKSSTLTIIRIDETASPDAALILGIALAQNRRTVLVHSKQALIPSNIRGLNRIAFSTFSELSKKIEAVISHL